MDEEIAIGDFVVSGGELPALMLIDAIARQLPGALNDARLRAQESFVDGLLDCPHYTRPEVYDGMTRCRTCCCPGNHAAIARWRLEAGAGRTRERRPDLLDGRALSKEEAKLVAEIERERQRGSARRNVKTAPNHKARIRGRPALRASKKLDPSQNGKDATP